MIINIFNRNFIQDNMFLVKLYKKYKEKKLYLHSNKR